MGAGALAGQKSGKTWIALALGCVTATGVVVCTSVTRDAAGTANRPPAGPAAQAPPP